MAEPIPYLVKSGDTYSSIAKKLGLKDWHNLKNYHNQHAGFNKQVGNTLYANTELLTPPPDEVAVLNGEKDVPENEEKAEQKQAEQKQQDEKKKEDEQKKREKAAKGEHDGKYFVVHGAKCVCDKAEDPTKTADLQVTTHNIIVLNDQSGKYLATEDDKTFIPPAATFGKCTLKPSSSGNLPCVLAAAPKWNKSYESTQVQGKKSLTEISELLCTTGGKITIKKHGQTDSVTNAHADNTNPLELAMVNPAVEQPKKKTEYPSISSISINQIESRQNFKPKNSKTDKAEHPIIYLRKGEEAKFGAQLSKGNKQLTSWVVYNDHKGSKESRILIRAQVGTEFSQSFEQYGKYRVEGYGKPKSPDFEKGKYDKCDPTCSIDIEVIENVLYDLECLTDSFSNRLDGKKLKFRQNFPVSFNAKFRMPRNSEEKTRLRMYALDGAGNVLTNVVVQGVNLTLTPQNSKAVYTIVAEYTTESGEIITKKLSGETESNTVVGISHSNEVVRPGTPLTFHVEKMRYDFIANDLEFDITRDEIAEIKWNLNGIQIGTGRSITIPGNMLLTPQKYVVEAYCKMANAFGTAAKHEEDDWHFEVKHNDIVSYQKSGSLKVGKSTRFSIGNNDLIFKNLAANETIYWNIGGKIFQGHYVDFTPTISGVVTVKCYINSQKGIIKSEPIVEAKITEGFWNDFGGSEISRASWGQTVDYCIKGENIEGEKIELHIYDNDGASGNDFAYSNANIIGLNNNQVTYHRIKLDESIKEKTTNIITDEVKLFAKAKLIGFQNVALADVQEKKGTEKNLTVNNKEEVYRAIIGDQNGRARHNPVDYDVISYVYANTTYPKGTKLKVKIFENIPWYKFDQKCDELDATGTVNEDGTLVTEINWSKLKDAKQNKKTKNYYAKIYNEDDDELLDGKDSDILCSTVLTPQSDLLKEASYVGAVTVGSEQVQQSTNGTCVCQQYDLIWGEKVSCEFRKKVVQIAKNLGLPQEKNEGANRLMAVMALETIGTFDHTYDNKMGYYGLIQFGDSAASTLKTTISALIKMSAVDQLDYVEKHIVLKKDKIKNLTDLYLCVLLPNLTGKGNDDNYVLWTNSREAYYNNPAFHKEEGEWENKIDSGKKDKKGKTIYKRGYNKNVEAKTYMWEVRKEIESWYEKGGQHKAKIYECDADNNSNENINAKDIVTFHIYDNGTIEKHIPQVIKPEYAQKYKYVYHDKDNKEHEICITEWHTTSKKLPSKTKLRAKPTHSKVLSDNIVNEGQTQRRVIYENGDIAEYGSNKGDTFWRLYAATSEKIELVKMPENVKYVKYSFSGTKRQYTGPNYFAGFIGALAQTGLSVKTTGSCFREGSCFPSQFHVNGESVDTKYFLNLETDQKFINAMMLFHFRERKVGNDSYFKKLQNTSDGGDLHDDHLHSGNFDSSKVKIIKEN
ncbi:DUF4280 domain-containing protein [Chryseobacterium formosus]|uniref:DUF4280 domain-containing protein n=1 Tax=Chryseobacterium formosus TaxID=1537363 RepID=A0ABT3XNH7_9FLAO|nr:DUF4280 domain-containing protein [Chryseobacterium formosus]MCX8523670.1 DUF4280 domain-containing protein [Chryseobacterium formosus]